MLKDTMEAYLDGFKHTLVILKDLDRKKMTLLEAVEYLEGHIEALEKTGVVL